MPDNTAPATATKKGTLRKKVITILLCITIVPLLFLALIILAQVQVTQMQQAANMQVQAGKQAVLAIEDALLNAKPFQDIPDNFRFGNSGETNIINVEDFKDSCPIEHFNSGDNTYCQYTNVDGTQVIGSFVDIPTLEGQGILLETSVDEIVAPIHATRTFIFVLIFLTAVVTVFFSFFVSRELTRPLEQLYEGSLEFGSGNLGYRFEVDTGDEVEELGNAFNAMAQNLQLAFTKLAKDKELIQVERDKMAVTLANIIDAVIVVDTNGVITMFNKAAESLTGVKINSAIGQNVTEVLKLYENDMELPYTTYCSTHVSDAFGGAFKKSKITLKSFSGEKLVTLSSVKIEGGSEFGFDYLVSLHDMSKEEELERMKLDFVSIAAHELRTPLTSIKGYLSVFIDENKQQFNEDQNGLLSKLDSSVRRLSALVENLLSVTRIERGSLPINVERADWNTILRTAVNEFKDRAREKSITLTFNDTNESMFVMIDKIRINEVLSNLLDNAINYTDEGGSIDVKVTKKDNELITSVQDTGIGIPKAVLPNLFNKFFRVTSVLTQGTKGTGLGLYISKAIVEKHHGKIWVDSEPGVGSTFSFSLPLLESNSA